MWQTSGFTKRSIYSFLKFKPILVLSIILKLKFVKLSLDIGYELKIQNFQSLERQNKYTIRN